MAYSIVPPNARLKNADHFPAVSGVGLQLADKVCCRGDAIFELGDQRPQLVEGECESPGVVAGLQDLVALVDDDNGIR